MRTTTACILGLVLAAGCGAQTGADDDGEEEGLTSSSLKMPVSIINFQKTNGWGNHHIMWHIERRWDLLSSSDLSWAKGKGWTRATRQEGTAGNGLEFLAMHRVMLQTLVAKFPKSASLFSGWDTPPTNPLDKSNPLPNHETTEFDNDMLDAISKLETDLTSFKSDDDFGLYLETALRPTSSSPYKHTTDKSSGIHNYMHNRFSDSSSPINIGDPTVNLQNKMFWRLHGWIDARWTAFRAAKGYKDTDTVYKAAIAFAQDDMDNMAGMNMGGAKAAAPCCPMGDNLDDVPADIHNMTW